VFEAAEKERCASVLASDRSEDQLGQVTVEQVW
jgi:hypothetical protein